jgi:hypothetical protein
MWLKGFVIIAFKRYKVTFSKYKSQKHINEEKLAFLIIFQFPLSPEAYTTKVLAFVSLLTTICG